MSENSAPTIRVATYNVHGCVGTDGERSETRIAEVIAALEVDIVGLQELDLSRARSAGIDQAGVIAEQLGWHRHFHAAMRQGEEHYGHAILSRHPLELRRAVCLPGVAPFFCREERAAIGMDVATDSGVIHVINTHLGLGLRERRLQAELLTSADWIDHAEGGAPLILLGDFNSLPGSRPHRTFSRSLRDVRALVEPRRGWRTFPTAFPVFAVDHIFVNAALHPLSVNVHRSALSRVASDHFPLVAELTIVEKIQPRARAAPNQDWR
ncbi:MAG: endonuclease/exonuclease/phosphatase family protein [Chthoniobacterales bacterium]|nr:endonuclease/exonuclease/phosphatase family protein [Chthoniobacterales bacterium]